MATPPTFVGEYETAWNVSTTPKTSASITTQVADVLVVAAIMEGSIDTLNTPTNTNTAQTWALAQSIVVGSYTAVYVWTTVATVAQSMTVSVTKTGANGLVWGFNVLHYRGSDGVGASSKTNTTGAPSLGLTTTTDNPAIVVAVGDWNAADGTTRTWRTVNGAAATEQSYFRNSANYTLYVGQHPDAGTAGSKTVGLSAPSGQQFSIVAIEVKGTAAAAGKVFPFRRVASRGLIMRGRR